MSCETRVPPLITDGAFVVSESVILDATREEVWKVVLDFDSYPQWNPFARKVTVVDSSSKPHPDPAPTPGKYLAITAHVPPTMDSPGFFGEAHPFCIITVIDHNNYRAAWELAPTLLSPRWLLHSERWQVLTEVQDGKTKYETWEVFRGPAAYLLKVCIGAGIRLGFRVFADSLKERVEALKAAPSTQLRSELCIRVPNKN